MYFDFDTEKDEKVKIKFAISPVSQTNALENLTTEIPHWNFEQVRNEAKENWNKELNRIQIKASENDKINFYTAMYHTFINFDNLYGCEWAVQRFGSEIHQAKEFYKLHHFFALGSYRALHPLFNIIQPKRNNDMVKSMMKHYEQNPIKMLPISCAHMPTKTGVSAAMILLQLLQMRL